MDLLNKKVILMVKHWDLHLEIPKHLLMAIRTARQISMGLPKEKQRMMARQMQKDFY